MKTSAKVTTISLLAAWSLGVAIFSACTVTSTTTNNTDGGIPDTNPTTTPTDSTPTPGTDAGDAGGGSTCGIEHDPNAPIRSSACQSCLQSKCSSQLSACLGVDAGSGGITCSEYGNCLDCCADNDQQCQEACDTAAGSTLVDAYDKLSTCGDGPENQDGGSTAASDNCVAQCQ